PEAAIVSLNATGAVNIDDLTCHVESAPSPDGRTVSGLHPAAGGDGRAACSGDMLLQSLVACSGVTFAAVSTAMGMQISSATVTAHGTMDFRGTLGVDRDVPIGLTSVDLSFAVETTEPDEKIEKLIQLTERYCVVLQTLKNSVTVSSRRGE
ncbi:MAG TPA: OsmC family peroxiredoxin, partial [Planctomycetes bacterium]|nr:OsmC family peroxiredoxin [Planctomycetota bacterium]